MPEDVERTYQVGLAIVALDGLFQDPLDAALRSSWRAGTSVTRYGRTWHLARMHADSPTVVTGEIGFVSENTVQTMFFDYATGEFVSGEVPGGVRVPFAIRVEDGVTAYQLRPGLVREATFTGALEALLNAPATEYVWSVRQRVEARSWEQWRAEVDKITAFSIRLDRPNPHYGDDDLIEDAVESIRLEYLRLSGVALDEGVDADADLFRQAVDHVLREYGRAAIHGLDGQGEESTWVKVKGMVASVTARQRRRVVGPPEVPEPVLLEVLSSTLSVGDSADLQGLSDEREA